MFPTSSNPPSLGASVPSSLPMGKAGDAVGRANVGQGTICMVMPQEQGCVLHPLSCWQCQDWRLTELWDSKILPSTTQACGDGCNGREGAIRLSVFSETHGVFHMVS